MHNTKSPASSMASASRAGLFFNAVERSQTGPSLRAPQAPVVPAIPCANGDLLQVSNIPPPCDGAGERAQTAICVLGVDPGLGGALAFYFPADNVVSAEDMPVVAGDIDAATLAARIAQMRPDLAIVEHVTSRPGQGVVSVFRFGCGFGTIRGVVAARPSSAPGLAVKVETTFRP